MNIDTNVLLLGCLAVIIFDTAGSLASRAFGFRYYLLIPGTIMIYAVVGFFAARHGGRLLTAVTTAGLVGIADATAGWAVSWWIGPGRPAVAMDKAAMARVVSMVMSLAVLCGFVGGVLRLLAGR